jgi:hypothetical protein
VTDLRWQLPWPELEIPAYRLAQSGLWSLKKFENISQLGYFQDWQGRGPIYALMQNNQSWMSTAWDELDSQAPHAAAAQGNVVVIGAGMGVVLYNILIKPEVTHVTLVERDAQVIEVLKQMTNFNEWTGIDKLTITIVDAFDFQPAASVDFLYVDIWADPGERRALSDMQKIQQKIQAKTVGWWTQEAFFLAWLEQKGYGESPTLEQYQEWAGEIKLPIIEQESPEYIACLPQVARSYCYKVIRQAWAQQEPAFLG